MKQDVIGEIDKPESRQKGEAAEAIIKKKKRNISRTFKMISGVMLVFFVIFAIAQYIMADKYDAKVNVLEENEKIGVNPNGDSLDFGDLPKGKRLSRAVVIENNGSMRAYVIVIKTGSISELIDIDNGNFILDPASERRIEFMLDLPISADKNNYEGTVIIFKIPKLL